jgi:ubiquinone/menaquinone biosynthesis C-methylase UbiE
MDNRSYYDDFAGWYERERGRGYHKMLDDLEVELVARYGGAGRVLEAGCGTGLVLARVAERARHASGIDLSGGMLARARARGLEVVQGSVTDLPYRADTFDCVYSVKVLAHVEDIRGALDELGRVTRPGGYVLAEFYNTHSLRYLIKRLKPPSAVSATTTDDAVYTRYDSAHTFRSYLPSSLRWVTSRGVRILTPAAAVHRLPLVGSALRVAERALADLPGARGLGGFSIAVLQKRGR